MWDLFDDFIVWWRCFNCQANRFQNGLAFNFHSLIEVSMDPKFNEYGIIDKLFCFSLLFIWFIFQSISHSYVNHSFARIYNFFLVSIRRINRSNIHCSNKTMEHFAFLPRLFVCYLLNHAYFEQISNAYNKFRTSNNSSKVPIDKSLIRQNNFYPWIHIYLKCQQYMFSMIFVYKANTEEKVCWIYLSIITYFSTGYKCSRTNTSTTKTKTIRNDDLCDVRGG